MPVYRLTKEIIFPPPQLSGKEGLVAIGGDLSEKRLLLAYNLGIFPWYSEDEPILWWSPDPRLVIYPDEIRISKSLHKIIKKNVFHITFDMAFEQVINLCAGVRRKKNEGTWIVPDMIEAYCMLFKSGYAHSVEAWKDNKLAGGLYGVSLGRCFFGESMFSLEANASKVAFVALSQYLENKAFDFIDCQVATDHLKRFGAKEIHRSLFLKQLKKALVLPTLKGIWDYQS
ncbi:leucyl/phenylalanyl-tRNA--protein transferase [Desulfobacterium sp. N47]|uniref:Leucyl/phenylalanyl-tRNA--protein transferase n=1 Tax=uncultured Desulfobacterium sp. TaxID=201089 RepID=E1YFV0_9BACT|nr:Leucyl/phenylalanyl-tRNA--protein transferase [uncultured Desulfobacterium sp.]